MGPEERIKNYLAFIYGEVQARRVFERLQERIDKYANLSDNPPRLQVKTGLSERDAILITYGDQVHEEGRLPLQSLNQFLENYLERAISAVHLLPFYPYSSDDGFSVIDYRSVDPELGSWKDIYQIGEDFSLMFDAVINHISRESEWFQAFTRRKSPYDNYFITVDPGADLSEVVRPRASPLLTEVDTVSGVKQVWTTFSEDQIDLNYANPDVLLEILDLILFYASQGAKFIRLDAIAYLWKELGTSCIHLPQTHAVVKLMRALLDLVAPHVLLITETNVPHKDNVAYFGDGVNEAQMVYNFALPVLTLHAFHSRDARSLSDWIETLELPSPYVTFFNFLASHDGIGLTPARDIISPQELDQLAERTLKLGGFVSYKNNADGTQSPYELNINYLDALDDPDAPSEDIELIARRFLASQAIMLALRGVPGIYFHSLFGSRNWREGVEQTRRYRTINRQKLLRRRLEAELSNPGSLRRLVFDGFRRLLAARQASPAFHPNGGQRTLKVHKALLALLRSSPDGGAHILCLHNVADQSLDVTIDLQNMPFSEAAALGDVLSPERYAVKDGRLRLRLGPYDVRWLEGDS